MYKCYELSELSKQEGFIGGDVNHNFDSESVLSVSQYIQFRIIETCFKVS